MNDDNQVSIFGKTNFRGKDAVFGIKKDDRRRHVYIIGKTGMGKTTLLENMVISDIKNGSGLCVVDPHGEFAEKMLDYIPSDRINDVIYFDPKNIPDLDRIYLRIIHSHASTTNICHYLII